LLHVVFKPARAEIPFDTILDRVTGSGTERDGLRFGTGREAGVYVSHSYPSKDRPSMRLL